jgi:dihydroorotate dehydrogenase electron transfer subunit
MQSEPLHVVANEAIGPYRLLRLRRSGLQPGTPGQFFMLEAPGRLLPRPFSLCVAPTRELGFLVDPIGPGTRAIAALDSGDAIRVSGPLGKGFDLAVSRPLLVGGGIGIAPFPYLSERLGRPPALLGFRTADHAEAAALVPNAEIVLDPTLVTDALPADPGDVLACGPEPMLDAIEERVTGAQLAREAPMACGYGACYGCVVERDGGYARLCVEGPVLRGGTPGSPTSPILCAPASREAAAAPAGQSPAPPTDARAFEEGHAPLPLSSVKDGTS